MSGKLGKASLLANTNTTLYEVPVNKLATLSVLVVNRSTEIAELTVAISEVDNPVDTDFIEHKVQLSANGGVYERTALVCSAAEKVVVHSSVADCSVRVHGFEEDV
jgi:hypothetical protein